MQAYRRDTLSKDMFAIAPLLNSASASCFAGIASN